MIIINNNSTPPQMATTTMDYIKALEQERKKILVFEKELPLSLQIVTRAIETCKQQMGSEGVITSSEGPVLEEFMPLRSSSSSSEEEIHLRRDGNGGGGGDGKPDWLRSVQLWNQNPEPKGDVLRKPIAVNVKRIGGAFHPFGKDKVGKTVVDAPASSTTENNSGGGGGRSGSQEEKDKEKEKEENSLRKARRCWSPELHRRFLQALQQLGGSHAATPKQIRELMKVDGLTNDEVKSHLQKYRLHIRRPTTPLNQSRNNGSPQQPQIVLVGGLWMPTPLNSVFTPVSSLPSELDSENQTKQKNNNRSPTGPLNSDRRSNEEDGEGTNSESSATSSSSQTTTASPPLQDSANEE